jgi:hypothetical protein
MPAIKLTTEHGNPIVVNTDWIVMVELAGDGTMANLHFGAGDRVIRVRENLEQVYELMQANSEPA